MTLALPEDLHRGMRKHPEVKWAEIVRRALTRELERLSVYDRLLVSSRLTEREAVELGRRINSRAARRLS